MTNADDVVAINTETVSRDVINFLTGELHQIRTDFQGALSGFATQEDLGQAVNLVANRAVEAATNAISGVVAAQEKWQAEQREKQEKHEEEQRQKIDTFIVEVRAKLDTFAPIATVASLRTNFEDSHRHFTSITGAHGEAIDTLKRRVDGIERKSNEDVQAIKTSVQTLSANVQAHGERTVVTQNSVLQFIDASKEYQAAARTRMDVIEQATHDQKADLEKVKSEQRAQDMIVRDVEGRAFQGMAEITAALYGDPKKKEPGLIADMAGLKRGLAPFAYMGSHLRLTLIGAGIAYIVFLIVTAAILQRPEIIASMLPVPGK